LAVKLDAHLAVGCALDDGLDRDEFLLEELLLSRRGQRIPGEDAQRRRFADGLFRLGR
jgi:hypothetical protein